MLERQPPPEVQTPQQPVDTGLAASLACAPEDERLAALDRYDVLDTPAEEAFDRITRLAKKLFNVPVAVVSFIDGHRQWHKSRIGVATEEFPREQTFCKHIVKDGRPLVVQDATQDPRFAQSPLVTGPPGIRFYTGMPLATRDGCVVGTLCVIDLKARELGEGQLDLLQDLAQMAMDELELRLIATQDSLTGVMSRRAFKEGAERLVALAKRHKHEPSCIAFDLDHFKRVNDTYGHGAGDVVLATLARASSDLLRDTDLIGRMGGEEFAALLPETSQVAALGVAEKLRAQFQRTRINAGFDQVTVTGSFGVASLDLDAGNLDSLLADADRALYEAKASGRNRCVGFRQPDGEKPPARRRVLKGGRIIFNDRMSAIDCTVRSLSDDGAGIDVYNSVGVPDTFNLLIKSDRLDRTCQVLSHTEKHLEVAFC